MTVVFLFSHQDDEFGVFPHIERHVANNDDVRCIYVTDGGATASPQIRNLETISVLLDLGVDPNNVSFIGEELNFCDGKLHTKIIQLKHWLDTYFKQNSCIQFCYVPALEGGHPDHDILHTATVNTLNQLGKLSIAFQYPLYNSYKKKPPLFNVFLPLPSNGSIIENKPSFRQRWRYFKFCLRYKSQWKTWMGLAPFVLNHFFWRGTFSLQKVSIERIGKRPHNGLLYFEFRNFITWREFSKAVDLICKK